MGVEYGHLEGRNRIGLLSLLDRLNRSNSHRHALLGKLFGNDACNIFAKG